MDQRAHPIGLTQALGRIPTGLYVATTRSDANEPLGFVASFVMQVGFDPPSVCIAIAKDRQHLAAIRRAGVFAISILDAEKSGPLMAPFLRKSKREQPPFDHVRTERSPGGLLVLADALAWIECRVQGEIDSGDHALVRGEVVHGHLVHGGDPAVHLRKNGMQY